MRLIIVFNKSLKLFTIFFIFFFILFLIYNFSNWNKFETEEIRKTISLARAVERALRPFANKTKLQKISLEKSNNFNQLRFLLSPNECYIEAPKTNFLGLILVTSYVSHKGLRSIHRQALNKSFLANLGFRRVFLLAAIPDTEYYTTQHQLEVEQQRFGDLVQGDFLDAYRNLSYKHAMGLGWAVYNCYLETSFIIKLDDDIVFNVYHIRDYLLSVLDSRERFTKSNQFLAGYIMNSTKVIRDKTNKWYVSYEEYAEESYPLSLSGWLYITTPATAARLFQVAQSLWKRSNVFWIDDIWITGIIREYLRIPLTKSLNDWFTPSGTYLACCLKDLKLSNLECPYNVGPNDGDTKRLLEFLTEVQKCYNNSLIKCKKRTRKHLQNTCVGIYQSYRPENYGIPELRALKLFG